MDKLLMFIENRPIPFAIMFAIWMGAAFIIRKRAKNAPEREAQKYLDWKARQGVEAQGIEARSLQDSKPDRSIMTYATAFSLSTIAGVIFACCAYYFIHG